MLNAPTKGPVGTDPLWCARIFARALAGNADLPLSARPDGPRAAAVGTGLIIFWSSLLGWRGDPFPKSHINLFLTFRTAEPLIEAWPARSAQSY